MHVLLSFLFSFAYLFILLSAARLFSHSPFAIISVLYGEPVSVCLYHFFVSCKRFSFSPHCLLIQHLLSIAIGHPQAVFERINFHSSGSSRTAFFISSPSLPSALALRFSIPFSLNVHADNERANILTVFSRQLSRKLQQK